MSTLYGAKKFIIPLDGDYGDDLSDEEPEDYDESEAICIQLWISPYSDDEHTIEVDADGCGGAQMPLYVARRVAKAIQTLTRWPTTKAGIKEIARLREKHETYEEERAAAKRATQSEGEAR
jgi:hypothetical protein